MSNIVLKILDWSEVWALFIPLTLLMITRSQPLNLKPVIAYLWIAFALNLTIDVIMEINIRTGQFLASNNPFYNLHSISRFCCFSIYFISLPQPHFRKLKFALAIIFSIFLIINFGFFEHLFNPDSLSGNLMTVESYILLLYCMLYYLEELRSDSDKLFEGPSFWIVTGLSIYVVVNFFVFLFYLPMVETDIELATNIWNLHNLSFILFCIFLAKAFYVRVRHQHTN